jgi:hypothetical protein
MAEKLHGVTWEAPEHHHVEKGNDWFWALGLLSIAGSSAAFIFGNVLFGIVILLGAITMVILAMQEPKVIPFAVLTRGIRVGNELYPYSTLESFTIDEDHRHGPQLLIKSKKLLMPLLIMPVPPEYVDDIDDLIGGRLPEEHLEEPVAHRILEFFGF